MSRVLFCTLWFIPIQAPAVELWFPLEAEAPVTCDFCGYRGRSGRCHNGIDIRARSIVRVIAAAAGTVERITTGLGNTYNQEYDPNTAFGNHVRVRHADGSVTIYAHLATVGVTVGQYVDIGEQLGTTDNSGWSTAPHLHFELRDPNGRRVDPYGTGRDNTRCSGGFMPECGTNPLWATCPPQPWGPSFADSDSDGYTVSEGDCLDEGMTPEGVPASAVNPGAQEVCNYTDDNCDGATDEGFPGLLEPCTVGVGACTNSGVYVCAADFMDTACSVVPFPPSPETCDGEDNDCDGTTDEIGVCGFWSATLTGGAPEPRGNHSAVWTGSEILVWGGSINNNSSGVIGTGGRYQPSTNTWDSITTTGAPAVRFLHSAVWTGLEMIVWGGIGDSARFNDGGMYNPSIDNWTTIDTLGAPEARGYHSGVWTGSEMIIWGGTSTISNLNSGGRYNPVSGIWTEVATTGAPSPRWYHTAIWSGSEMIVWGGAIFEGVVLYTNTGGRYNPVTASWLTTNTTTAPPGRNDHTSVWSGLEMIVWGGTGGSFSSFGDGGAYDPTIDSWDIVPTTGAPSPRYAHTAIWTESGMIVWGGFNGSVALGNGAVYNLEMYTWLTMPTSGAPSARLAHSAIWTGSEMIIWGGRSGTAALNSGSRYMP